MAGPNIYHQDGTVWRKTGTTGFGEDGFGSPEHIKCRYVKGGKLEFDSNGEEFASAGKFFALTEFAPGDRFASGTVTDATPSNESREIANVRVTPSIKNTYVVIQHWLR